MAKRIKRQNPRVVSAFGDKEICPVCGGSGWEMFWQAAELYNGRMTPFMKKCSKCNGKNDEDSSGIPFAECDITRFNFNAYNYKIVDNVCDIYIDLCFVYDKEISIIGFSNLTGIDTDTLNEWGNERVKLSSTSTVVYKKLRDFREESLSNKLVTGRQNPVGVLGVLNHHYGWNISEVRQEQNKQRVLTADELPKLGDTKGINLFPTGGQIVNLNDS